VNTQQYNTTIKPLVSVIIPTFNRANLVKEAIESVLAQTFQDVEIIVIDDGSTDETKEVVSKMPSDKTHYIYQNNMGPAAARNAGIRIARGQYIAFLDSDDLWLPKKLEKQLQLFEKLPPEVGLVHCSVFLKKGDELVLAKAKARGNPLRDFLLNTDNAYLSTPAILVKKECFNKTGLFDETRWLSEDVDFCIKIAQHYKVDYVDEPLVTVREIGKSLTKNFMDFHTSGNMFTILDRVFDDPACPEDLKSLRKEAYAKRLLQLMGGHYVNNRVIKVWEYFLKAFFYHPKSIKLKDVLIFIKSPVRPFSRDSLTSQNNECK
jgi:glycosyltransferase involved in cell wall biosynthesis